MCCTFPGARLFQPLLSSQPVNPNEIDRPRLFSLQSTMGREELAMRTVVPVVVVVVLVWAGVRWWRADGPAERIGEPMGEKVTRSEEEWRQLLTAEQYHVTRRKGTERAFTGAYWNTKTDGVYHCSCCGQPLFDAKTKFDSGTGWPSFW